MWVLDLWVLDPGIGKHKIHTYSVILTEKESLPGVTVEKKGIEEGVKVYAPVVISDAGIFNTLGKLLPPEIRSKPGKSDMHLFL